MLVAQARSRLAHEVKRSKHRPGTVADERVAAARRDLAAAKLDAYIRQVVAAAPPLSSEQRERLTLLLRVAGAES